MRILLLNKFASQPVSRLVGQTVKQAVSQAVTQTGSQSLSQSISQPVSESINTSVSQPASQSASHSSVSVPALPSGPDLEFMQTLMGMRACANEQRLPKAGLGSQAVRGRLGPQ